MNNQQGQVRPRRVGEVWVRRESEDAAIYDPATGALHRLNPSALAIWELCDGATTVEEMASAAAELTSESVTRVAADIEAVLQKLSNIGIVLF